MKIQELCDIFSHTVGLSIAVVDIKLIRIAATKRCSENQFLNINGLVQKKVIADDNTLIIYKPTRDEVCEGCVQKKFCNETLEICAPLHLKQEAIGCISFITFSQHERSKVTNELPFYRELIDNFVDFIEHYLSQKYERSVMLNSTSQKPEKKHAYITFNDIIGNAPAFKEVINKAKIIAPNDVSVMITGESGTGKEMLAHAIHHASTRRDKPFVALNCGAIPENLIESELFGYVNGAFTGASVKGKPGKFESADGGTIFLDEITEMPISLQSTLLRVLQEQKVERLGSNKTIRVDVRVISATNKDITSLIGQGLFRADLYYRLNVIPLELPSLRDGRRDDIVPLMNYFMTKHSEFISNRKVADFVVHKNVFEFLKNYHWPGNIRELENVIIHMLNMMDDAGNVTMNSLPIYIRDDSINFQGQAFTTIENLEKQAIIKALDFFGDDTEGKQAASTSLGIGLTTLYRKMKKYNICLGRN
jgi:transcriptional regulator with PAS, ATPase and Fis domain